MYSRDGLHFSAFLAGKRANRNVTLEQLGGGLCSASMLKKIETGDRFPDKLLRDRLLERLGMANDGFEDILWPSEFTLWQDRQELIHAIEDKDVSAAENIISLHEGQNAGNNKIERQFYLVMQAQVMQYQNIGQEKLRRLFCEALNCTLPGWSLDQLERRLMAVQEWDLLLEYVRLGGDVGRVHMKAGDTYQVAAYETLLSALQECSMDSHSRVKVFPKAVYYLCMERMKLPSAGRNYDRMLQACSSAVELLRSTMRMYFLHELLEVMERVLLEVQKGEVCLVLPSVQEIHPERVCAMRETLEGLYHARHVPIKMENCVYLYSRTQNYSVGEVVRKRRQKMGMSVEELCRGICDEKTLRRLESGKYKTQRQIVAELFERLELKPGCWRQPKVTDKKDEGILRDEYTKALKNRDMDAVSKMFLNLKEMPSGCVIDPKEEESLEGLCLWYATEVKG